MPLYVLDPNGFKDQIGWFTPVCLPIRLNLFWDERY